MINIPLLEWFLGELEISNYNPPPHQITLPTGGKAII